MSDNNPQSWPGLGAELFDLLTGRRAEISYQLDNMRVQIPSHATANGTAPASSAAWTFDGAIRISSRILDEK